MKTIFCIFAAMVLQISSSFTQVTFTAYRQSPTSSVVYFAEEFNDFINKNKKSKSTALFFSFFPGGGQFYTNQTGKGLIVMGGMGACTYIAINSFMKNFNSRTISLMIFAGIGIYVYSFIDAQWEVDAINSRSIGFKYDINPQISLNIKPYFVSYSVGGIFNPEVGISVSTPIY